MAAWKFTDAYEAAYPALAGSILSVLVFDAPTGSPVNGTTFTGTLDLQATNQAIGTPMAVLSAILGMSTIPMTGTVTTSQNTLSVHLTSTNNDAVLKAIAACIPLIGGTVMRKASIEIRTQTQASASKENDPEIDAFDLKTTIAIGHGTGEVVTRIPFSEGVFAMTASFDQLAVGFAELDFLVPGGNMRSLFPGDGQLPRSYYDPATTTLNLLALQLTLEVQTNPKLSVSVATVSVSLGVSNIPLSPNALFLNPLAIWVSITNPQQNPTATWGLGGSMALYPAGRQTSPPSAPPDFVYDLAAEMPTKGNPQFSVTGTFENPLDLPVAQILKDLTNDTAFDTGISSQLTLQRFDFAAMADTSTGRVTEFSVDVAMSATQGTYVGLFSPDFGVKDFRIAVTYSGPGGAK